MSTAALFTVAKTWKQMKCPLIEDWIKKIYIKYIKYIYHTYHLYKEDIYIVPLNH